MTNESEFRIDHGYSPNKIPSMRNCPKKISKPDLQNCLFHFFPILTWLPLYNIKKDLLPDFVTGLVVGVMKVSQGLAYAQLAGQHPVYGLYTCLFPPLVYVLFASSKHLSFGSHATTDLMLGSLMEVLVPSPNFTSNSSLHEAMWKVVYDERILYVTAITFFTGCILIFIAVFRLGFITRIFSKPLQRGFVFAAVCYLYVSQSKTLLGISVVKHSGPLGFFKNIFEIFKKLTELNSEEKESVIFTSILSLFSVIFLILIKLFNKRFKNKLPLNIPIPGEILLLICGTLVSAFTPIHQFVKVIGNIPQGLPQPQVPDLSKAGSVIGTSFAVAVVGIAVAISLGNTFADRGKYPFSSTQEIQAIGFSNLFGSFFMCLPAFGAMSRSCVQFESGGKSQFVGCFSSVLIIMILFAGPVLNATPVACLSAMVVVAVANLLLQIQDLKVLWPSQKLDCLVWITTCVGVLFTTLTLGLIIGIIAALLSNIVKISFPKPKLISVVSGTDVYRETGLYKKSDKPPDHVITLSFHAPISFLNASGLIHDIKKKYAMNLVNQMQTTELVELQDFSQDSSSNSNPLDSSESDVSDILHQKKIRFIVLDCSGVGFIDSVGVHQIWKLIGDFEKDDVKLLLADCPDHILQSFVGMGYNDITKISYVTVDDAVKFAKSGKC